MNLSNASPTFATRNVDEWLYAVNQVCGRFQAEPLDARFGAGIRPMVAQGLNYSFVDAQRARLFRTRRDTAGDEGKHYFATFQLEGRADMQQNGHVAQLQPGDITLIDASQPCTFQFDKTSRQISLIVPRPDMEAVLRTRHARCAVRIAGDSRLGVLANQLLSSALGQPELTHEEGEATVSALATLLRPAWADVAAHDPHERAFRRATDLIEANLTSPELTPAVVAQEIGVSLRSLYRIFSRKNRVVAQYIKARRLELSAERLRSGPANQNLATLCFDCGFADTSSFTTAFKKRFGVTPGQYRSRLSS